MNLDRSWMYNRNNLGRNGYDSVNLRVRGVNCENVRYHTTDCCYASYDEWIQTVIYQHNYFQGSRMSDMINDAFGMHSDFEQGEKCRRSS
ncbi:hypothetical protein H5410_032876 [Solanum commersonii]|uniref:Uncharacterized protein n=1 Tax=Solanum commersonii TaxID=4109 RepID=A0A9J5YM44_SOLCO|nr:hypothetical protein H5410_032876 [Solanum commersonii]